MNIRRGRLLNIIVEGNIACGKTKILKHVADAAKCAQIRAVCPTRSIAFLKYLQKLVYRYPEKYSLAFQSFVQLTMLKHHQQPLTPTESGEERCVKLLERSIYSARHVFAENLVKSDVMRKIDLDILDEYLKHLHNTGMIPPVTDIFYLKTQPLKAYRRMKNRGRKEEMAVHRDGRKAIDSIFMTNIHNLHEKWLEERPLLENAAVHTFDAGQQLSCVVQEVLEKIQELLRANRLGPDKSLDEVLETVRSGEYGTENVLTVIRRKQARELAVQREIS